MGADRARRHRAIFEVLRAEAIGNQADLARALDRRGFPVTQATLSRDLKELRIPCVPTADGYRYVVPESDAAATAVTAPAAAAPRLLRSVATAEVIEIDANEAVAVVRTLTGRAQGVAVYLDGLKLPEVLATIAGDDTILVVPRRARETARLRKRLEELFGLGRAGSHRGPPRTAAG